MAATSINFDARRGRRYFRGWRSAPLSSASICSAMRYVMPSIRASSSGRPSRKRSKPEVTRASLVVLALTSLVCAAPHDDARTQTTRSSGQGSSIGVEEVARGLNNPVYLTAPEGDARLFVVEQPGRIRIIDNGRLVEKPFLDITGKVGYGGERGLLSVAFHPLYSSNGFLFVNY